MVDTLLTRDSKGKVRQVDISCELDNSVYKIKRSTGLYNGKFIKQPEIIITEGKAKRTLEEQAQLVYNSNLKSYLDKGYKNIKDFGYNDIVEFNPEEVLSKTKTDRNNVGKPMLCDKFDFENKKLLNKKWYSSFKLDGVRSFLYYEDNGIKTASRGGQNYDIATTFIRNDSYINALFKNNTKLILDGEVYYHGWPLNKISSLCRLESIVEDHKKLMFYCYDIANENLTFEERLKLLQNIKNNVPENSSLKIVEHVLLSGKEQLLNQHDIAIKNGYEGLVVRDPNEKYKFGARGNRMLKIKMMDTETFKIIGYELGLRGAEDMCFVLETKDGKQFKAKPEGDLEIKKYYVKNIKTIINKAGDIRFFHYTEYGIPNLPVFVAIRDDLTDSI